MDEMEKLRIRLPGQLEQSFDPVEYGKMRADSHNKSVGDMTDYDCPKCKNRGNIAIPKEDGGISFAECSCMKIRRCVQKMEASGLRDVIKSYTFDAYHDTEGWQKTIKQGAMAYAENPDGWLLFCGQSGSGKTHLCTAVCRHLLLAGKEVIYMPWRQDVRKMKAMDGSSQVGMLEHLQKAPILFIDDLFKTARSSDGSFYPSAADINIAIEIIDYREAKRLTTIISTERTTEELVDIDEATGGRIVDMSGKNAYSIGRDTKRNYRLRSVVAV